MFKFFKRKKAKIVQFKTGREDWEKIGIYVTEEQYNDLFAINLFMNTEDNRIPVHYIMLVLKTLGLLPTELPQNISRNDSNNNTDKDFRKDAENKFGIAF